MTVISRPEAIWMRPIVKFDLNNRVNNYFAIRNRNGDEGFRIFHMILSIPCCGLNDNANGPFNHSNFAIGR